MLTTGTPRLSPFGRRRRDPSQVSSAASPTTVPPRALPPATVVVGSAAVAVICLLLAGAAAAQPAGGASPPALATDLIRALGYLGSALLIGTVVFWAAVARTLQPAAGPAYGMAWLGIGLSLAAAVAGLAWCLANPAPPGHMVLSFATRLVVLATMAVAVRLLIAGQPLLPALVVLAPALALTVVTARPEPVSLLAVLLTTAHVLAAGAWLGGLAVLFAEYLPHPDPARVNLVVTRFPVVSLAAVGVLTVTGTIHALVVAGSVPGLVGSPYGRVLLDKLVLIGGMLLAALGSHRYVRSLRGRIQPVQVLALFVGAELALGLAALWVTATLTRTAG